MVKTQKIEPNNYIMDAYLRGKKLNNLNPDEMESIIDLDITTYYDCVTYLKVLVEEITDENITNLTIHLVLKTFNCDESEVIPVIESYLEKNFIQNVK